MFASFDSVSTPGVKVWDFSKTYSGAASVALEDDCATVQLFLTGGTSTAIVVRLPSTVVSGKQITIKNDALGANQQSLNVLDYAAVTPTFNNYLIGAGQVVTFVSVQQASGNANSQPAIQWIPLQVAGYYAANRLGAVISGSSNVAFALAATVAGGSGNTASGSYSAVGGGQSNTASSTSSVVAGGNTNTASGPQSFVGGGTLNLSNGTNSGILAGHRGSARSISNIFIHGMSNVGTVQGLTQAALLVLAGQTTNATATVLVSDVSAAGTTNQLVLPNNSAYYVRGSVIANVTGGGDTKAWEFTAAIKRGANAASTTLVGTPTVTSPYADTGASAWTVDVTANTTLGCLTVTVTGAAATTIRWVCKLESTEVTY